MSIEALKTIPEEEVWLASRKSARTRRAYRVDVAHFMRTFNIRSCTWHQRIIRAGIIG
jgi:hypothetical protein